MRFSALLKIAACINAAQAIVFGLWTNPLFRFIGVPVDTHWSLIGRMFGAMALGFVVLARTAERIGDPTGQRAVCLSFLTSASAQSVLLVASMSAGSSGRVWPFLALAVVQVAACALFLSQKSPRD